MAAHDQSVRAEADSALTLMAEDLADRFFASGLSGEAFFRAEGFEAVGTGFVKTDAARGRAVCLLTGGARAGSSRARWTRIGFDRLGRGYRGAEAAHRQIPA